MLIRTISVALLLLTIACDPTENGAVPQTGKTTAAEAKVAATGAPAASPVPEDAPPKLADTAGSGDDRAAYSSCLRGCDDATVAYADKAKCRFNCEGPAAPTPASAGAAIVNSDPVEYVVGCIGRCYSDGNRSATCTSACKTAVAALPAAPSASVLDTLGTCVDACHLSKDVSETNRATCNLNCTQAARVAGPAPATAAKP